MLLVRAGVGGRVPASRLKHVLTAAGLTDPVSQRVVPTVPRLAHVVCLHVMYV